jgi:hypothetical protein
VLAAGDAELATAAHRRPTVGDYNVVISVRDELAKNARKLLRAIARCERRVHDPYGARLDAFNRCIRTPLSVEVELTRFEPILLGGALHRLAPGPCLRLVGALDGAISDLSEVASGWIADIETGGAARGRLEHGDAKAMRQVDRGIIRLETKRWKRACRPRSSRSSTATTTRSRATTTR